MFPNEDYVYRLLRALIVRQSSKMFLDSVLAIFLTYPVRKLRMVRISIAIDRFKLNAFFCFRILSKIWMRLSKPFHWRND